MPTRHSIVVISVNFDFLLSFPKRQLRKFIGCLKMSANDEPKDSTYYAITPLRHISHSEKLLVQIDGHFSVLEAEKPEPLME